VVADRGGRSLSRARARTHTHTHTICSMCFNQCELVRAQVHSRNTNISSNVCTFYVYVYIYILRIYPPKTRILCVDNTLLCTRCTCAVWRWLYCWKADSVNVSLCFRRNDSTRYLNAVLTTPDGYYVYTRFSMNIIGTCFRRYFVTSRLNCRQTKKHYYATWHVRICIRQTFFLPSVRKIILSLCRSIKIWRWLWIST